MLQAAAKQQLRQRMNLSNTDVPVIGVVTRLTHQKGIHLIKHAAWRTLERGGQFVLLGSAPDPKVQVCSFVKLRALVLRYFLGLLFRPRQRMTTSCGHPITRGARGAFGFLIDVADVRRVMASSTFFARHVEFGLSFSPSASLLKQDVRDVAM
jgi:hypothetical protein